MAIEADRVVVTLEAQTDAYNLGIQESVQKFESAMARISAAGQRMEAAFGAQMHNALGSAINSAQNLASIFDKQIKGLEGLTSAAQKYTESLARMADTQKRVDSQQHSYAPRPSTSAPNQWQNPAQGSPQGSPIPRPKEWGPAPAQQATPSSYNPYSVGNGASRPIGTPSGPAYRPREWGPAPTPEAGVAPSYNPYGSNIGTGRAIATPGGPAYRPREWGAAPAAATPSYSVYGPGVHTEESARANNQRYAQVRARLEEERRSEELGGGLFANRRGGLNTFQYLEGLHIGRALWDTTAASGSPLTGLLQESGRIGEFFALGNQGVGGTIKSLGTSIAGLMTPIRVVTGGVAALGVAGVAAFSSWQSAQDKLANSLNGLGRRTGYTVGQLNRAAEQGAAASYQYGATGVSNATGRELAGTYAGAGINGSLIGGLVGSSAAYGRLTGTDASTAGQQLAAAFADPTRGADALDKALGFLDAQTRETIRSLQAQGDVLGAQSALFAAFSDDLKKATDNTNLFSSAWDKIKNNASNAFSGAGQWLAGVFTPSPQQRLATLERQGPAGTDVYGVNQEEYRQQQMTALRAQIEQENANAAQKEGQQRANSLSQTATGAINEVMPDIASYNKLVDQEKAISSALDNPLVKLGVEASDAADALDEVRGRLAYFSTGVQRIAEDSALATARSTAYTAAEKASAAALQAFVDSMRQVGSTSEAAAAAQKALNEQITSSNAQVKQQLRDAQDELALAGQSPFAQRLGRINQRYQRTIEQESLPNSDATRFLPVAPSVGVRDAGTPTIGARDRDLAIRTVAGEAGGEGPVGQQAVANVIFNRLRTGKWGSSLSDVITAPKQFSVWNPGDPAGATARHLSTDSPAYKRIGAIVDGIASGQVGDVTGGSTNYYNPRAAHPAWGRPASHALTIGNHRFLGGRVGTVSDERVIPAQSSVAADAAAARDASTQAAYRDLYDPLFRQPAQTVAAQRAALANQRAARSPEDLAGLNARQGVLDQLASETGGSNAYSDQTDELKTKLDAVRESATASAKEMDAFNKSVKGLDELRSTTRDTLGGFASALLHGASASTALREALTGLADKALNGLTDSLVGYLLGGKGSPSLGSVAGGANASNGGILGALGGSGGGGGVGSIFTGLLGSIFGGFKAGGGDVSPGTSYVVGEKGVELFTPNSAGTITPNAGMVRSPAASAASGAASQALTMAINVSGARGNSEIQQMVASGVQTGMSVLSKNIDRTLPGRLQTAQRRF